MDPNQPLHHLPSTGSASWIDDAPMPPPLPPVVTVQQTMNANLGYISPQMDLPQLNNPFGSQQYQPNNYVDRIPFGQPMQLSHHTTIIEHFPEPMVNPTQAGSSFHSDTSHYSFVGQHFSPGGQHFSPARQHFLPGAQNFPSANSLVNYSGGGPSSSGYHAGGQHQMLPTTGMAPRQEFLPDFSRMSREEFEAWYQSQTADPIRVVHVIPVEQKFEPIQYVHEDRSWVRVNLRELDTREFIAEFSTTAVKFVIDGLLHATGQVENPSRFCLGAYTCTSQSSLIIRCIGKGCLIEKLENGDVVVTNLSKTALFIQSLNYAKRNNEDPQTVFRLAPVPKELAENDPISLPSRQMTIFHAQDFPSFIEKVKDTKGLIELVNHCHTRISFVKGFGQKYPNRDTIYECPVWVELSLTEQLKLVDKKFEELFPPPG